MEYAGPDHNQRPAEREGDTGESFAMAWRTVLWTKISSN